MSTLLSLTEHTLYQHTGAHISHADLRSLLTIASWQIKRGQHWAIVGGNDEQRSAILQMLGNTDIYTTANVCIGEISLQEQQRRIDDELIKAKTGVADEIFAGTPVNEIIADAIYCRARQTQTNKEQIESIANKLIKQLGFESCIYKHFRELSSGETRRLLIITALLQQSDLLLMQDPLEGIDSETRPVVDAILKEMRLGEQFTTSLFISSRPDQLPEYTTHLAYIDGMQLRCLEVSDDTGLKKLLADLHSIIEPDVVINVPELPRDHPFHKVRALAPGQALVNMTDVCVQYADAEEPVITGLDWTVLPLEHWRIIGKNGAGKSTLLKLITGDHPQVYKNNIKVCGFKRGSGESIWDVKRHIGYMSSEMLWNYRGSGQLAGKALNVVMSGLYDSIGLYTQTNSADKAAARDWLNLFELSDITNKRFQSLGLAEQRLVLIARAMIKRPSLLILDEPCQGLDAQDRQRVLKIISKLIASSAVTLLYVSHHDDEQIDGVKHTLAL